MARHISSEILQLRLSREGHRCFDIAQIKGAISKVLKICVTRWIS